MMRWDVKTDLCENIVLRELSVTKLAAMLRARSGIGIRSLRH